MAETFQWDQSRFDATLKEYLKAHESQVWPKAINKKGFFIAKAAIPATPIVEASKIQAELAKRVFTTDPDSGQTKEVSLGIALAAHRARAGWSKSAKYRRASKQEFLGKAGARAMAWDQAVRDKLNAILGARNRAAGFIRLGWLSTMRELQPLTGLSYGPSISLAARQKGRSKGWTQPATEGNLMLKMENMAHARSEKKGGFMRIGEPPLQKAFEAEAASMQSHLEGEMRPEADKFNRAQH